MPIQWKVPYKCPINYDTWILIDNIPPIVKEDEFWNLLGINDSFVVNKRLVPHFASSPENGFKKMAVIIYDSKESASMGLMCMLLQFRYLPFVCARASDYFRYMSTVEEERYVRHTIGDDDREVSFAAIPHRDIDWENLFSLFGENEKLSYNSQVFRSCVDAIASVLGLYGLRSGVVMLKVEHKVPMSTAIYYADCPLMQELRKTKTLDNVMVDSSVYFGYMSRRKGCGGTSRNVSCSGAESGLIFDTLPGFVKSLIPRHESESSNTAAISEHSPSSPPENEKSQSRRSLTDDELRRMYRIHSSCTPPPSPEADCSKSQGKTKQDSGKDSVKQKQTEKSGILMELDPRASHSRASTQLNAIPGTSYDNMPEQLICTPVIYTGIFSEVPPFDEQRLQALKKSSCPPRTQVIKSTKKSAADESLENSQSAKVTAPASVSKHLPADDCHKNSQDESEEVIVVDNIDQHTLLSPIEDPEDASVCVSTKDECSDDRSPKLPGPSDDISIISCNTSLGKEKEETIYASELENDKSNENDLKHPGQQLSNISESNIAPESSSSKTDKMQELQSINSPDRKDPCDIPALENVTQIKNELISDDSEEDNQKENTPPKTYDCNRYSDASAEVSSPSDKLYENIVPAVKNDATPKNDAPDSSMNEVELAETVCGKISDPNIDQPFKNNALSDGDKSILKCVPHTLEDIPSDDKNSKDNAVSTVAASAQKSPESVELSNFPETGKTGYSEKSESMSHLSLTDSESKEAETKDIASASVVDIAEPQSNDQISPKCVLPGGDSPSDHTSLVEGTVLSTIIESVKGAPGSVESSNLLKTENASFPDKKSISHESLTVSEGKDANEKDALSESALGMEEPHDTARPNDIVSASEGAQKSGDVSLSQCDENPLRSSQDAVITSVSSKVDHENHIPDCVKNENVLPLVQEIETTVLGDLNGASVETVDNVAQHEGASVSKCDTLTDSTCKDSTKPINSMSVDKNEEQPDAARKSEVHDETKREFPIYESVRRISEKFIEVLKDIPNIESTKAGVPETDLSKDGSSKRSTLETKTSSESENSGTSDRVLDPNPESETESSLNAEAIPEKEPLHLSSDQTARDVSSCEKNELTSQTVETLPSDDESDFAAGLRESKRLPKIEEEPSGMMEAVTTAMEQVTPPKVGTSEKTFGDDIATDENQQPRDIYNTPRKRATRSSNTDALKADAKQEIPSTPEKKPLRSRALANVVAETKQESPRKCTPEKQTRGKPVTPSRKSARTIKKSYST